MLQNLLTQYDWSLSPYHASLFDGQTLHSGNAKHYIHAESWLITDGRLNLKEISALLSQHEGKRIYIHHEHRAKFRDHRFFWNLRQPAYSPAKNLVIFCRFNRNQSSINRISNQILKQRKNVKNRKSIQLLFLMDQYCPNINIYSAQEKVFIEISRINKNTKIISAADFLKLANKNNSPPTYEIWDIHNGESSFDPRLDLELAKFSFNLMHLNEANFSTPEEHSCKRMLPNGKLELELWNYSE